MATPLEIAVELLRDALNSEDWYKVEQALEELEKTQEGNLFEEYDDENEDDNIWA